MTREKEIKVASSEEDQSPKTGSGEVSEETAPAERPAADEGSEGEASAIQEPSADAKIASLEDKLLRTMADFENYKRRTAQQFENTIKSANDRLLLDLLEVVDNFERALQHANGPAEPDSLRKGTELIYNQMTDLLARNRLTPIEAVGKPFDPNLHEAMLQTPSDEHAPGVVAFELTRGYKIDDRVLRHSRVAVSTGPPAGEDRPRDSETSERNE